MYRKLLLSLLFLTGNFLITNLSGQISDNFESERENKFNIEIDERLVSGDRELSYPPKQNQSLRLSETRIDSAKKYTYTTVFDSVPEIKQLYTYENNTATRIHYDYDESQQQWNPSEKDLRNYNAAGQQTKHTKFIWESGSWKPDFKEEYDYTSNGETEQYSTFRWDDTNDQWEEGFRVEHFYDSENLLDHKLYYSDSSGTSNFGLSYKLEFDYTEDDYLSLRIDYVYDENSSSFVESLKTEWSYNANEYYSQIISYYWLESTQTWQWDSKEEYTYDNNQNVIKIEEFVWDFAAFTWVEDSKTENDYDALNNKVLEIESNWDSNEQSYVPSSKKEWDYEGDLKLEQRTYTYNETASSFEIIGKAEFTYNAEEMLSSEAYYTWDSDTDSWSKSFKSTYKYNQFGDQIMYTNYNPDATGENWEIGSRWFYYFDVLGTGKGDIELTEKFNLYPNPATTVVNFNLEVESPVNVTLQVFSTSGKLVYSEEVENYSSNTTLRWNCRNVPSGTYIAVWQTETGNYTRKISVR